MLDYCDQRGPGSQSSSASFLLHHKGITQYYEWIFQQLGKMGTGGYFLEEAMPTTDNNEALPEADAVRVPWSYRLED